MRIAIGGILQETNSFCPIKSDFDDFKHSPLLPLLEDDAIIAEHRGKESEIGGFITVCEANNIEIVPTLAAFAMSSGNVTARAFFWLLDMLLEKLRRAGSLDAVLLSLHGSMVVDGLEDAEGEILYQVRKLVGDKVPIGCSFDVHADITERIVEHLDVLVGYETHMDYALTGTRVAEKLVDCIKRGIRPHLFLRKLPAVMGARNYVLDLKRTMEREPGVLTISVFDANPWTDITEHGPSVVVITEHENASGQKLCSDLAERFWEARHEALRAGVSIADAVTQVAHAGNKPVVLVDSGDLIGAGAVGDSVVLVEALLAAGITDFVTVIYDPVTVWQAFAAGEGKKLDAQIGGKLAYAGAVPLPFAGTVKRLYDGWFTLQGLPYTGIRAWLGKTALISCDHTDIIVTSTRIHPQGAAVMDTMRIDASHKQAIVLKSAAAGFTFDLDKSISVKTPGLANWDFRTVPLKNVRRPMYPLDPI